MREMLEVKHLTYEVTENGKPRRLVDDVSFSVGDGEMLVITGPNGGGKSTIAKLLMGIERADSGEILLDGRDLSGLNVNERAAAGLGYAFQQPPAFKGMTVERLLQLAAGRELPEAVCCDLLSSVGICAREYLKRERTLLCPAENASGLRLPRCWQSPIKSVFLMSRRRVLISGAFLCW